MRKLVILLLVMLSGCWDGDGNVATAPQATSHAPLIADLQLSPSSLSYMQGDGSVSVTAAFTFSDNGLDILSMKAEMSDGTTMTMELPDLMNVGAGSVKQTFDLSTAELGSYSLEVWLVDAAGDSSNHLSAQYIVESPVPHIDALDPAEVPSGSGAFELGVTGTGFLAGAMVTWDGADRATRFVSGTQLVAFISATDVEIARTVEVRVRNPQPTPRVSDKLSFVIFQGPLAQIIDLPILITETTDGLPPNGPSVNGGMEPEGSYVVFASRASNLIAGDTNEAYDLFTRRTCNYAMTACTPATSRVVMGVGGTEPNGDIGWTATGSEKSLATSFNVRYVAFVSSASNLVVDDTNGVDDVFLFDTCIRFSFFGTSEPCTPTLIRVSMAHDGAQSAMPSSQPAVADDGRYVVFVSEDPNLVAGDTNGAADVFLRDTCRAAGAGCTPSTKRVSVANDGGQANAASGEPVFTGRYVAFSSLASNLVEGDSNDMQDVFIHDTCIGQLACTPSTQLVSIGRLGDPADAASSDPQVSYPMGSMSGYDYHGRFVVFVSSATNLVAGDTNGASDVFERDLCVGMPGCTPSTVRVSVTSSGGQISGDSRSPDFLRWDGETMPFVTDADGVVPGDTNGIADVYVRHHCPLGAPSYCVAMTKRISLGADGAQTDGASYAPRMSHDPWGAWATTFISEASNILPDAVAIPNHGNIYMATTY